MNNKHLLKTAFLCFLVCLACLVLFLHVNCKPTSAVQAKLILHAPLYGTARADGTLYVFGKVTNVGNAIAYDGKIVVIVNEGENEYSHFLGDFEAGECKSFECDLVGYCWEDETRCTFRLEWSHSRMLSCITQIYVTQTCVSMDSARVSHDD